MDLPVDELREGLRRCLLTESELAAGPDAWRALPDPFPAWQHDDLPGTLVHHR